MKISNLKVLEIKKETQCVLIALVIPELLCQYANFLDMKVASEQWAFAKFNPYIEAGRIDTFFQRLANVNEYKNLWTVVKLVLLLSHGQATVERGFSVNKLFVLTPFHLNITPSHSFFLGCC